MSRSASQQPFIADILNKETVGAVLFYVEIAGCVIKIHSIYSYVWEYCRAYLLPEQKPAAVDFELTMERADIAFEKRKSEEEDIREGRPVRRFSEEYLETLAVYRRLADKLLERNILLMHGSAVAVDGKGYLFTAPSGTGKSTHTRLWREYFGNRAVMINDDKPLLKITEKGAIVYGTPWDGKHRLSTNAAVPLQGICILKRDCSNRLETADRRLAYPMIVQQTHRPLQPEKLTVILQLIDRLMQRIPIYQLYCNMEYEAVEAAYGGMKKEQEGRLKNKIFQSRDLCLRTLDTNSLCAKDVRRNGGKNEAES